MPTPRNPLPRALRRAFPLTSLILRSGISRRQIPVGGLTIYRVLAGKKTVFYRSFGFLWDGLSRGRHLSDFVWRCFTVERPHWFLPDPLQRTHHIGCAQFRLRLIFHQYLVRRRILAILTNCLRPRPMSSNFRDSPISRNCCKPLEIRHLLHIMPPRPKRVALNCRSSQS